MLWNQARLAGHEGRLLHGLSVWWCLPITRGILKLLASMLTLGCPQMAFGLHRAVLVVWLRLADIARKINDGIVERSGSPWRSQAFCQLYYSSIASRFWPGIKTKKATIKPNDIGVHDRAPFLAVKG